MPEKHSNETLKPLKTRANGRATREKILQAAREIIIERGTDSLSIDRVISLAGVSKGTYLYHFPHREALIEALVKEYAKHLNDVQSSLENEAADQSPLLTAYEAWYEKFSSGKLDNGSSPLIALAMASHENRRFMEPVRQWYRSYFDRVKQEPCGAARALIYTLAYDALFFHHLFGTDVLTTEEKRSIIEELRRFSDEKLPREGD